MACLVVAGDLLDIVLLVAAGLAVLATESAEVGHATAAAELGEVDAAKVAAGTHAGHTAHAAELGEVLLGSLVLLVLINPLVEVGLEEVESLVFLEQAGPVLLLEVLLLELHLDVLGGVVDLAGGGVNLGKELEVDMVLALESARGTGEGESRGLDVQLDVVLGDIGDGDGEVDKVLVGVGAGRALGPENYCTAVLAINCTQSYCRKRAIGRAIVMPLLVGQHQMRG